MLQDPRPYMVIALNDAIQQAKRDGVVVDGPGLADEDGVIRVPLDEVVNCVALLAIMPPIEPD